MRKSNGPECVCNIHLQWKRRLFVVDSDENLANNEFFAVITEHKFCTKAFIVFSL